MLDRAALRRIVFSDHDQLEELNAIVHPEVERMRDALVEQARSAATGSSSATSRCCSSAT